MLVHLARLQTGDRFDEGSETDVGFDRLTEKARDLAAWDAFQRLDPIQIAGQQPREGVADEYEPEEPFAGEDALEVRRAELERGNQW